MQTGFLQRGNSDFRASKPYFFLARFARRSHNLYRFILIKEGGLTSAEPVKKKKIWPNLKSRYLWAHTELGLHNYYFGSMPTYHYILKNRKILRGSCHTMVFCLCFQATGEFDPEFSWTDHRFQSIFRCVLVSKCVKTISRHLQPVCNQLPPINSTE